ncbi:MAG: hypothetical protein P8J32_07160 [bacterium]|nr:hypothetical protein [bacterium]
MKSKITISNHNHQIKHQLEELGFVESGTCYVDGGVGFTYYKKDDVWLKIIACFLYTKTGSEFPLVFSEIKVDQVVVVRRTPPELVRDVTMAEIKLASN